MLFKKKRRGGTSTSSGHHGSHSLASDGSGEKLPSSDLKNLDATPSAGDGDKEEYAFGTAAIGAIEVEKETDDPPLVRKWRSSKSSRSKSSLGLHKFSTAAGLGDNDGTQGGYSGGMREDDDNIEQIKEIIGYHESHFGELEVATQGKSEAIELESHRQDEDDRVRDNEAHWLHGTGRIAGSAKAASRSSGGNETEGQTCMSKSSSQNFAEIQTLSDDEDNHRWEMELLKRSGNISARSAMRSMESFQARRHDQLLSGLNEESLMRPISENIKDKKSRIEENSRMCSRLAVDIENLKSQVSDLSVDIKRASDTYNAQLDIRQFLQALGSCLQAKLPMIKEAGKAIDALTFDVGRFLTDLRMKSDFDMLRLGSEKGILDLDKESQDNAIFFKTNDSPKAGLVDEFGRDLTLMNTRDLELRLKSLYESFEKSHDRVLNFLGQSFESPDAILAALPTYDREGIAFFDGFSQRRSGIREGLGLIFMDVSASYASLRGCIYQFKKFKDCCPNEYNELKADARIGEIASPFVHMELMSWICFFFDSTMETKVPHCFDWEQEMLSAGVSEKTIADLYLEDVIPFLRCHMRHWFDPFSRTISARVLDMTRHISSIFQRVFGDNYHKSSISYLSEVGRVLRDAENRRVVPRIKSTELTSPNLADISRGFISFQLKHTAESLILLENLSMWKEYLNEPDVLSSLKGLATRLLSSLDDISGMCIQKQNIEDRINRCFDAAS